MEEHHREPDADVRRARRDELRVARRSRFRVSVGVSVAGLRFRVLLLRVLLLRRPRLGLGRFRLVHFLRRPPVSLPLLRPGPDVRHDAFHLVEVERALLEILIVHPDVGTVDEIRQRSLSRQPPRKPREGIPSLAFPREFADALEQRGAIGGG